VIALVVNLGMWLERFMIIITSLYRDYMPSAWGLYYPTFWDWATLLGSLGLFFFLLLLFLRFLPMISIFEMRTLLPGAQAEEVST
jgi:molybdopterin-containing oxidoreductase family membrane subunit